MTCGSRLAAVAALCAGLCGAQQYVISTVAGGAPPSAPAFATNSSIGVPQNIVTDSSANLYFTSLNCVFEVFQSDILVVLAGTSRAGYSGDGGQAVNAQLSAPVGLAVDAAGDVFIADAGNNRIREIAVGGIITTVAGNGVPGFAGDGGPAVSAELSGVAGVAVDAAGNLFIADSGNNRIRKVTPAGIITTVAGNGKSTASGDGGPATSAQLSAMSIAIDASDDLFIGDSLNYRVREVSASGTITTVAGAGTPGHSGDGGPAVGAQLSAFHQIAVDPLGNIYIADSGNSAIREVASGSGIISTVAGNGQFGFFGDNSSATIAALWFPYGVTLDSSGNIYIADTSNFRLRVVTTNGIISTFAGTGFSSYSGDGGTAVTAQISGAQGMTVDKFGNLFVADTANNVVREVAGGVISTFAGNGVVGFLGDNGNAVSAQLSGPLGVAADGAGDLFIADSGNDRVREVTSGTITTVAGNGNSQFTGDGTPAVSAPLSVASIAIDGSGDLFIGDPINFRVREVLANGNIATVAGNGVPGFSGDNGPASAAQLSAVAGVAVDSSGNVYVSDAGNQRIRKISSAGTITTVAGNGTAGFSGDGGPAISAQLHNPSGVTVDMAGNLYIADTSNNRVREVSTTGVITTIAGNGISAYTGDGGSGVDAALSLPAGLALGKAGILYVADTGNNAIRLLTPVTQTVIISSVVDSASESAIPFSPGKIAVIYGSGLGPAQLAINQPVNGYFGDQLAGTTVSFRGVSAPIYYASATQVAAIVPYEISGSTSVPVEVSYQGQLSAPFNVSFAPVSPGLFTANATGAGQAAAINVVDGTLNTAANPVKIGAYISLYATGEGQTSPNGIDGKLSPSMLPIPAPVQKVTATVGGIAATVAYAGAVPGVVAGLMQVNIQIPASSTNATTGVITTLTPGGYVPVILTVGSTSTVAGAVWIAVSAGP